MAGEWPTVRVGDLADSISETHKLGKDRLVFLNTSDILLGRLLHGSYSSVRDWPGQAKKSMRKNDILFSEIRPANGRWAYVDIDADDYVVSTKLMVIRARANRVAPRFLYHFLTSSEITAWLQHLAESRSGTFPQITFDQVAELELALAPPADQDRIVGFLDAIDNKIDLNRRMNETLEGMARALFQSWFVDFDPVRAKLARRGGAEGRDPGLPKPIADLFPDSFEDSELGEIPKGWKVQTVGEHIINFDSKRIPVSGAEREKRQGPFPYHGAAGVMDHVDGYLFDGIYLLVGEDGSVVQDSGLAVTQYVWGKIWVNNHAHVLQGKGSVSTEQLYIYFHFEPVTPYITGAVQPKLSQGRMNLMPFVFGGRDVCRVFAETVRPWFSRIRAASEENKSLAALRDTLLPKLISGELRVGNAEEFVGRVV